MIKIFKINKKTLYIKSMKKLRRKIQIVNLNFKIILIIYHNDLYLLLLEKMKIKKNQRLF